jgi:glycogen phosphorylase
VVFHYAGKPGYGPPSVESVCGEGSGTLPVGAEVRVSACVKLGGLTPDDVKVELYLGRLDPSGEIVDAAVVGMDVAGQNPPGQYTFETRTPCTQTGFHGYTFGCGPTIAI